MDQTHRMHLERALTLAREHSHSGVNGPFGAVMVHGGDVVAEGWNRVVEGGDPTAHAEIVAIRRAAQHLQSYDLSECTLYSSCQPCPMCEAAIFWARIPRVYYAATGADAHAIGFDDDNVRQHLAGKPTAGAPQLQHLPHPDATLPFREWLENPRRQHY